LASLLKRALGALSPSPPITWRRYLDLEKAVLNTLNRMRTFDNVTKDVVELRECFKSGFAEFCNTGRTSMEAYIAMRQLHMATRGESDKSFAVAASIVFPIVGKRRQADSPFFTTIPAEHLEEVIAQIRRDGIYVFPMALNQDVLADLKRILVGLPVTNDSGNDAGVFPDLDDSPRVFFAEADLLKSAAIRSLILDPLLVEIARRILQVEPIFENVSIFHTRPHSGDAAVRSAAAQLYHIDADRMNFLNFFIYLDDVTENHGPHWFVKGSHVTKPHDYWQDRRFSDAEIETAYAPEDVLCIAKPAGSVIVANTSAFHKGSPPVVGSRTLLQIRYVSSLFGAEFPKHEKDPFEQQLKRVSMTGLVYSRMLLRFGE
jgi:hypothetical protein